MGSLLSLKLLLSSRPQFAIILFKIKPEHWISVAQLGITLIAVFAGPWWAVKRSQKQFLSQKLWDKRHETYPELLDDLSLLKYYYGNVTSSIEMSRDYEPPQSFMEKVHAAQHTLEMHASIGEYLISAQATKSINLCVETSHKHYHTIMIMQSRAGE